MGVGIVRFSTTAPTSAEIAALAALRTRETADLETLITTRWIAWCFVTAKTRVRHLVAGGFQPQPIGARCSSHQSCNPEIECCQSTSTFYPHTHRSSCVGGEKGLEAGTRAAGAVSNRGNRPSNVNGGIEHVSGEPEAVIRQTHQHGTGAIRCRTGHWWIDLPAGPR